MSLDNVVGYICKRVDSFNFNQCFGTLPFDCLMVIRYTRFFFPNVVADLTINTGS